jgi:hypothetical protein
MADKSPRNTMSKKPSKSLKDKEETRRRITGRQAARAGRLDFGRRSTRDGRIAGHVPSRWMRAAGRRFGDQRRSAGSDSAVCHSHRGLPYERRRLDGQMERRRTRSGLCSSCSGPSGRPELVGYPGRDSSGGPPRLGQVEDASLGEAGSRVVVPGRPEVLGERERTVTPSRPTHPTIRAGAVASASS